MFDNQNAKGKHPFSAPARLVRAERCLFSGTGLIGPDGVVKQRPARASRAVTGEGSLSPLVSKQRSARTSRAVTRIGRRRNPTQMGQGIIERRLEHGEVDMQERASSYFQSLQDRICQAIEGLDGRVSFREDRW